MEGYLFDEPAAQAAFTAAAEMAHAAGRKVAITLSDGFCVDRHRAAFRDLVEEHTDILFANEDEICSLYEVPQFDEALQRMRGHCEIACLTRSEKGAVVMHGDEVHIVDAEPVAQVVDTTGAGDQFAAGFLYGYTQGRDLFTCGRLGAIAAAEIISHFGARPEHDLKALAAEKLG
jgi:sugar/nucleoside kinase (ribokinase family)